MTAAHPPTWPPGRALAGWWPQLDRFRPRSLWLYHLLLHRVEAPVAVARPAAQERLDRLLLEALSSSAFSPGEATAAGLAALLRLDAQVLRRLLADLGRAGLVQAGAGPAGAGWGLTPAGRQALQEGSAVETPPERRTFYFAEGPPPQEGPRFLPLDRPPAA